MWDQAGMWSGAKFWKKNMKNMDAEEEAATGGAAVDIAQPAMDIDVVRFIFSCFAFTPFSRMRLLTYMEVVRFTKLLVMFVRVHHALKIDIFNTSPYCNPFSLISTALA